MQDRVFLELLHPDLWLSTSSHEMSERNALKHLSTDVRSFKAFFLF